jgi:ferredoxin
LSQIDERRFGRLTLRIDRHLCVGFGDCIDVAPDVFELDAEGVAVVKDGAVEHAEHERLLEACRACPVDALTAHDENGKLLAP